MVSAMKTRAQRDWEFWSCIHCEKSFAPRLCLQDVFRSTLVRLVHRYDMLRQRTQNRAIVGRVFADLRSAPAVRHVSI